MEELKIEVGIPIPEKYPHSRLRRAAQQMKEGDSVLCKDQNEAVMVQSHLNRLNKSSTTRREGDGKQYRCWCLGKKE